MSITDEPHGAAQEGYAILPKSWDNRPLSKLEAIRAATWSATRVYPGDFGDPRYHGGPSTRKIAEIKNLATKDDSDGEWFPGSKGGPYYWRPTPHEGWRRLRGRDRVSRAALNKAIEDLSQ